MSELVPLAIAVLGRMPQPISMVSGPITTGGLGSREKNIQIFAAAIAALEAEGVSVFNQLPFQDVMAAAWRRWAGKGYCMAILDDFYAPLLHSGKIRKLHFIPGWESSVGARWEFDQCRKLGIETEFFDDGLIAAAGRAA